MKHLIIFLNFCRSRIGNPVFQQFSQDVADRRDVTMLFLPRPLEERELLHEVADLRRKEKQHLSDVTFHICADFERPDEAKLAAQTVRLIRRLFPSDEEHKYHCLAYFLLPDLKESSEKQVKTVWNNLADTNNAITDYTDFLLYNRIYLYQDASQQSLGEFLYETIHFGVGASALENQLPDGPTPDFPPVFATFNATGITYPEENVRQYLQRQYVSVLLKYSLPEYNEWSIETCNEEAKRILSFIPINNERICLQSDMFLNLDGNRQQTWKPAETFWKESVERESQGLNDIPHDEWLAKIRQRLEVLYKSRFRDSGVDYFFQLQSKKSSTYLQVLEAIISQEFNRTIESNAYTPEAQKNILRSLVNLLQLKVIELQKEREQAVEAIKNIEYQLESIQEKWNGINFFARFMKKDDAILKEYLEQIGELFIHKTYIPGCDFATKLLNELIPTILAMTDKCDYYRKVLDEAISLSEKAVQNADPSPILGNFSKQQVATAASQLGNDSEYFQGRYQEVIQLFSERTPVADAEDLIARIYAKLGDEINGYIRIRIDDKTLPPVLYQAITERMSALYAEQGGLQAFIDVMKQHAPLNLALKNTIADHYVLITPVETNDKEVKHIITDDVSHIEILHLQQGIRLTDLDGFSGQKMFIEPTIF